MRQGFDNDMYIRLQSERIRERIAQFGGKLYLEFGGKLFDDNHASRVLPGFQPDSKLRMLKTLADRAEVVIAVNAQDIAVTIATIADLPIDEDCTGAIIYQVMKNPNLKLEEIKKLKEALVRMESVIQRDNREPWDKHDCA